MSKPQKVAIIGGAGHIGAPLGIVFANNGVETLLYDVNKESLNKLMSGSMPFIEKGASEGLKDAIDTGRLHFSSNPTDLRGVQHVVVTIGTPLDEFHNPKYTILKDCISSILDYLNEDASIVLRSTVAPGMTQYLDDFLRSKGRHSGVAFCPERVAQGFALAEIAEIPQIVSATTDNTYTAAEELFKNICQDTVRMEPLEAEYAKLVCNAYRYINFATTNELYMLVESAGIDYNKMLRKAKWRYPRMNHIPGPGLTGGPCLMKDTMQLFAFHKHPFGLGRMAQSINESLPNFIASRIKSEHGLYDKVVGILGMSFKAENDDVRDSLSFKLRKILEYEGAKVICTDEYVKDVRFFPKEFVMEQADILVIGTPHKAYSDMLVDTGKPIIDVWGYLSREESVSKYSD